MRSPGARSEAAWLCQDSVGEYFIVDVSGGQPVHLHVMFATASLNEPDVMFFTLLFHRFDHSNDA